MIDAASLILRERGSSMKDLQEKFEKIGVIPVIVIDEAKNAEPLAEALVAGGLPCAEITFRTQAAEESIRIMTQKYPDMMVGAGTVLNVEQVELRQQNVRCIFFKRHLFCSRSKYHFYPRRCVLSGNDHSNHGCR